MPPLPLPTHHEDRAYTYTQLVREGDVAIFVQAHKDNPRVIRHEVVKIRIAPAHVWPDGRVTPEREVYPGSTSWGMLAWTMRTEEEARAKLHALQCQPTLVTPPC